MENLALMMIGFLGGLIVWDMRERAAAQRRMKEAEEKLTESMAKLSELHNSSMLANQELQNKVQSLEQAYKAASSSAVATKRFI
jgi:hypothetical protein